MTDGKSPSSNRSVLTSLPWPPKRLVLVLIWAEALISRQQRLAFLLPSFLLALSALEEG